MSNYETDISPMAPEFIPTTETQNVDAVVVGAGVLGLLVAKRLVDFGQNVAIVEQADTMAAGPSIKNHGWLHTGIVHSLSVADPLQGGNLVRKLQYGHQFFTNYAPECLDEPFEPTYAIARDPELAHRARDNWTALNVPHREMTADEFFEVEPGMSPEGASYFFENTDSRVNNRLLFAKLLTDIKRGGALALNGASYEYDDEQTITVSSNDSEQTTRLRSPLFFYTTGTGLDDSYEKLTNESLGMQYWKSHLLLLPRVTNASIVSLDRETPIVINHGDTSIVNRSYDEVTLSHRDDQVDPTEVARAFDILREYYPRAADFRDDIHAIACLKPNVPSDSTLNRHSVAETVYEPKPGHVFALPGKMTEAPYVADSLVRANSDKLNLDGITRRPLDIARTMRDAIVNW